MKKQWYDNKMFTDYQNFKNLHGMLAISAKV